MTLFIETKNLVFDYDGPGETRRALHGIDLWIREGEHVAVVGPNGSGKSTLLKHFNALLTPTQGEVYVGGLSTGDSSRTWEIRSSCGMVFQNPDNQIVATIVEEDVAFALENLGLPSPEIKKRVKEALEAVGMGAWSSHASHLLSGGQKQRLAIAGVLAMRPRCLLLDEPTSLLDPGGQQELLKLVSRLNRDEGITVVHVTHYIEEAVGVDRVLVLNDGRLAGEGHPRVVLNSSGQLRRWGLEAPGVLLLVELLRSRGVPLPAEVNEMDALVESICSLKR